MTEISVDNDEINLTSVAEVTENVSTEESRRENGAAPMVEVVGMIRGTNGLGHGEATRKCFPGDYCLSMS